MRTVIVANLGMPRVATPVGVAEFLRDYLADPLVVDFPRWLWRPILERRLGPRIERLAEQYREACDGEDTPVDRDTQAIAAALQATIGSAADVRPAYRYGEPSLAAEIHGALSASGDVVVVPLFPQRASASSETVVQTAVRVAQAERAVTRLEVLRIAPDDPAYIVALVQRLLAAQAAAYIAPEHFVVSFPEPSRRYDRRERSRYHSDCELTVRALTDVLDVTAAHVTTCFQSRFGAEPSNGLSLFSALRDLGRRRVRSVAVITPGFLTDGFEIRAEAGVQGRRVFLGAGGKDYVVAKPLGAHPHFIDSLARRIAPEAFLPIPEPVAQAG